MLSSILENSIMEVDSIKKYYDILLEYLPQKEKMGRQVNFLDGVLDVYISSKLYNDVDIPEEMVTRAHEIIDHVIEDMKITKRGDKVYVQYKYKNEDELKRKGIEINIKKARYEFYSYSNLSFLQNESSLLMLITKFEFFVASLLRLMIEKHPDGFLSDKTMTYAEIVKQGDKVKDYLIETEVTKIMYKGFLEWIKIFEARKFVFSDATEAVDLYNEMSYRRNILVHNNGIVNHIYCDNLQSYCAQNGIKYNDRIFVTEKYIEDAICTIKTLLYCLTFGAAKIEKEHSESILDTINDLAFRHLSDKEWRLCCYIYKRLSDERNQTELDRLYAKVNYWIAMKHYYGLDKIRDAIIATDFSAFQPIFKMAKYILLEEYEDAMNIINAIFPNVLNADAISTWPLFIDFRETEFYHKFVKENKDEFSLHTTVSESSNVPEEKLVATIEESTIGEPNEHVAVAI